MKAIGVFDSGYGGLTILKEFVKILPGYDFVYLGDSARSPYGSRSFDIVHKYTLQAVNFLFNSGCPLVILACNTASAKALRTIQQNDLVSLDPLKRVLGVIRPTVEYVDKCSTSRHIGVLGTKGTVLSRSYVLEIQKLYPDIHVEQHACPMWVPLVENNELGNVGCDFFVKQDIDILLSQDPRIDTIILGCTHYPLLVDSIKKFLPSGIKLVMQDVIVANSLVDYLNRHNEIHSQCSKSGEIKFYTTDQTETFDVLGSLYFQKEIKSQKVLLS
jgi:glutamate racemase